MATDKDLFDDSTMTFGEHLEVLRFHLIRALIGLTICVIGALAYGEELVKLIRYPVDQALRRANFVSVVEDDVKEFSFWEWCQHQIFPPDTTEATEHMKTEPQTKAERRGIELQISAQELVDQLHQASPERFPPAGDDLKGKTLSLHATSDAFFQFRTGIERIERPVTFNVQEAFVTYMKVSFIAGLITC